ncbi:hypothetical protein MNB_SM-3-711 [hydrothermal vent metagenome]|uniref:Uncharacterized protein n=1 Tax=hydrothermal vent metagenome TaxID=652676 RepID=A0A1W1D472_9ZZZZ
MQTFGKFETNFGDEYLTQHYIYINEKDESREDIKITLKEFEAMLQKKRKTVAGTIFLYNPTLSPIGYNNKTPLAEQGFEFDDNFYELNFNDMMNIFSKSIGDGYRGKLIEIKYLFNLNKANIEPTSILEKFDADLDRYYSNQLTQFDKEKNYHDYKNIRLSGKFVFFAHGHKFDRHHKEIIRYAQNISKQAQKLGKEIAFLYDRNYDIEECKELAYYISPLASGKMKHICVNAFKKAFSTNPPTIQRIVE